MKQIKWAQGRALTPGEVAALFNVDPKTVARWAKMGKLDFFYTPGGHRRYREEAVRALYEGRRDPAQSRLFRAA